MSGGNRGMVESGDRDGEGGGGGNAVRAKCQSVSRGQQLKEEP